LISCKECGAEFNSLSGLHKHLKAHKIYVPDYYVKHFPRRDKFSGDLIEFKEREDYFAKHFNSRQNLVSWLKQTPKEHKASVLLDMLEHRVKSKQLAHAPTEIELFFAELPPIQEYKDCFGSYSTATKSCGVDPLLTGKWSDKWSKDFSGRKIYVDSREQKPLAFKNSEALKLDIGDYAVSGNDFRYTFVDRKSFADWASTLVNENFDRFRREIERCAAQKSFLWVVVEAELESLERLNQSSAHKHNLSFVGHQMRILQHEYRGNLQFYFSGGRKQSQDVIPKLLCLGDELWLSDAQYWIPKQKGELDF